MPAVVEQNLRGIVDPLRVHIGRRRAVHRHLGAWVASSRLASEKGVIR
jgi:hypothetical protein